MSLLLQEENKSFSEMYHVVVDNYSDVEVTSLPLSARAINCLQRVGIHFLRDLLLVSPETLMEARNLGKKTLTEIVTYCKQLSQGTSSPTISPASVLPNEPNCFIKFADDIAVGDFDFADQLQLTEKQKHQLEKYKKAYSSLDADLVFECVCNPDYTRTLIELFCNFLSDIEIRGLLNKLPSHRKLKKAAGFINAFTAEQETRNALRSLYKEAPCRLCDIDFDKLRPDDTESLNLLDRFVLWCRYDIQSDIDRLFVSLYKNERMRDVVKGRACGKTLDAIGTSYGITRERVRQIEAKAKRIFARLYSRAKILQKIFADLDGESVVVPSTLRRYSPEYADELAYLLKDYKSAAYTYDPQLDVFIIGDDTLKSRVDTLIDDLPEIIKAAKVEEIIKKAKEDEEIPEEMMRRALLDAYQVTGELYHRSRLSLGMIYERVLQQYYPDGIYAYDSTQIQSFREHVHQEYGDVRLPENDRALTARITGICILCGRGKYTVKKKKYIPDSLKNRIYRYIKDSDNMIFMTNTLFSIFEDELVDAGITNKYYLQGVLHEMFGDEFYFRKDYVSKDPNMTSMYSEIEEYISNSDYPVSKQQIRAEFPGVSEIVIMLSVGAPNILNYYGQYLHSNKLKLSTAEIEKIKESLHQFLSDNEAHSSGEVYTELSLKYEDVFRRNGVFYSFGAFSLLEYLYREEFQFSRPFIALPGVEIGRPAERLHEFIYNSDEIAITDLFEFARENKIYIQSMLEFVNSCNDQYVFADEDNIIRTELTGLTEEIASQIEEIVFSEIGKTVPIRDLLIWGKLPTISIPWTDWLVYSTLKKWGARVEVSTSSGQLRYAVPLVAPLGKMAAGDFKDLKKEHRSTYQFDNLDDIDSLLIDVIGEDDLLEDV